MDIPLNLFLTPLIEELNNYTAMNNKDRIYKFERDRNKFPFKKYLEKI